ncbi:MAG: glycosyltransferase family 4 protein [Methylophilaceae bacterium]
MMTQLGFVILAFAITAISLVVILRTRLNRLAMDTPNQRSLHAVAIPRTGGLAIMAGVLGTWCFFSGGLLWAGLVLVLVLISVVDDIRGLSIKWRFLGQWVVSAIFIYAYYPILAWWGIGVVALMVWMINLYNFMDGSDGLAGGMALFGFGAYAIAAGLSNDWQISLLSACIASASLAFLFFNFNPAKVFMGDSGSIPLGFLAASIGVYGWQTAIWPIWFPVLIFSPFIIDATITLLKRAFQGESIFEAHRSHYYQRLVLMGFGHKKTAVLEYALMSMVSLTGLLLLHRPFLYVAFLLLTWAVIYGTLIWVIDRHWAQHHIK